jgi:hypothetical protein
MIHAFVEIPPLRKERARMGHPRRGANTFSVPYDNSFLLGARFDHFAHALAGLRFRFPDCRQRAIDREIVSSGD